MSNLDEVDLMSILELEGDLTDRSLDEFIEMVRGRYGLAHVAYVCPSFKGGSLAAPFGVVTYDQGWVKHYVAAGYGTVDPVVKACTRSVAPFDWRGLPREDKKVRRLFGEAREAGIGRQGLGIPLRGPVNGIWALLVATSDEPDEEWGERRVGLVRDLVHVAHYVHQRAFQLHHAGEDVVDLKSLTPREIEALQWSADGARLKAIAIAMRISVETVRAHLESARYKLQALNRAHAVTKALRAGLIK